MSNKLKILTWNYHQEATDFKESALVDMVVENEIDIVVLQEARGAGIPTLLQPTHFEVEYPNSGISNGVRVFLKNNEFDYESVERGYFNKWILVNVRKRTCSEWIVIAAIHFYSKRDTTERMQMWESLKIIEAVKNYESRVNNKKTIMVGDFNHNPHESNMLDPIFLNAKDTKHIVELIEINNPPRKKNNVWYNPMWNFLGDYDYTNDSERITGTYFWSKVQDLPMWNLFDGILLRPQLMDRIIYKESKILTKTNTASFVKDIRIGDAESMLIDEFSDHLPVLVTLKIA